MDEFGPFVNQPVQIPHGLNIHMDQSIYESTSLYMNSGILVDVIE